ncbi:heavy metal transporter [Oceanicola sp. 22II-s10i]|uniref:heavy-metal-associated domain-containing protein n=1 Tax=Oceanicola sp. 22II-s10i TaxID=1317116 RepID=UPI000B5253E4|nr:heavy-metal-associated domain-containing protein [Oceanicola sp. 22II-s10i]OWU82954.1 heavy metal transporter [Oceanicola sp. 22II-s10i]
MTGKTSFHVPDMSCGHCEKALRSAFATAMPGADVTIDLASHDLTVAGDAALAEATIRDAGYTPERRA